MPKQQQTTKTTMSRPGPSRGTMNSLCGLPAVVPRFPRLAHRAACSVGDDEGDERDDERERAAAEEALGGAGDRARLRVREVAHVDDGVLEHRRDFDRARAVLHLDRRRIEARRRPKHGCAARSGGLRGGANGAARGDGDAAAARRRDAGCTAPERARRAAGGANCCGGGANGGGAAADAAAAGSRRRRGIVGAGGALRRSAPACP